MKFTPFLPKAIIIKLRKILFANGISFLRSKTYQELLDYRQEAKKFKSLLGVDLLTT